MLKKISIKFGLFGALFIIAYQLGLYLVCGEWYFQWPLLLTYLILIVIMSMGMFRMKLLNGNNISLQNAFLVAFLTGLITISANAVYNYAFIKAQPEVKEKIYEGKKSQQIAAWRTEGMAEDKIDHNVKVNDDIYFSTSDERNAIRNFINEVVTIAFISILIALVGKSALKTNLE